MWRCPLGKWRGGGNSSEDKGFCTMPSFKRLLERAQYFNHPRSLLEGKEEKNRAVCHASIIPPACISEKWAHGHANGQSEEERVLRKGEGRKEGRVWRIGQITDTPRLPREVCQRERGQPLRMARQDTPRRRLHPAKEWETAALRSPQSPVYVLKEDQIASV